MTPAATTDREAVRTALGALCVLAACVPLVLRAMATFPADLSAVYMAGYLFDIGRTDLVYDAPDGFFGGSPPLWLPYIEQMGLTGEFVTPFVYPPVWAAVIAPVAGSTTPEGFFWGAIVVQMPMLALSPLLAWRIAGPRAPALGVWLMLSGVLLYTSQIAGFAVDLLQPQILVTFLTLLAFERYRNRRAATAGMLLGLAAMLKIAPAALVLIFLLDRNWRSLGAFAATCAAIGVAGLLLAGVDLHLEFLAAVQEIGGILFLSASNFSVAPVLAALSSLSGLAPPVDLAARNIAFNGAATDLVSLLSKGLFLALLGWTIWQSRNHPVDERLVLRLLSLSLLLNLFGPLGWIHYYLLPMFLLPALPGLLRPGPGYALLALVAVATSRWAFWKLYALGPGDLPVVGVATATLLLLLIAVNAISHPQRANRGVSTTK